MHTSSWWRYPIFDRRQKLYLLENFIAENFFSLWQHYSDECLEQKSIISLHPFLLENPQTPTHEITSRLHFVFEIATQKKRERGSQRTSA